MSVAIGQRWHSLNGRIARVVTVVGDMATLQDVDEPDRHYVMGPGRGSWMLLERDDADQTTGAAVSAALTDRLTHALTKHPRQHASVVESLGVLLLEVRELEAAIQARDTVATLSEALDVAASALRLILDHHRRTEPKETKHAE